MKRKGYSYAGFYKGSYLKSAQEYIYARYLDYINMDWHYEVKTYELSNGGSYKPDFYLPSIDKFVEIKGTFNYESDLPRIKLFESDYSLTVDVLLEKDLRDLLRKTPMRYESLKSEWKQTAVLGVSTAGKNNPRYGVSNSKSTREKIKIGLGKKLEDPEFREYWISCIRKNASSPKNIARLRECNKRFTKAVKVCEYCGKTYTDMPCKAKKRKYCSHSCAANAEFSKTKGSSQKLLNELAIIFAACNTEKIISCPKNKIKPVLQPFYSKLEDELGIKDYRTVADAFNVKGRIGILSYLQSIAENIVGANANDEALELGDKEPLG